MHDGHKKHLHDNSNGHCGMFSLQPPLCNVAHKAMKLMLQVLAKTVCFAARTQKSCQNCASTRHKHKTASSTLGFGVQVRVLGFTV